MTYKFEDGPRPHNILIGYRELGTALMRPAGSLRTCVNTLPFKRWRVGQVSIWDADEVAAFVAAKNQS